jgi:hypothetical protein
MELGEQIELTGFLEQEPGELLIAKKLIGNHVRSISDKNSGFEKMLLALDYTPGGIVVQGTLTVSGESKKAVASDSNVFFALDKCLKKLSLN